MPPSIRRRTFLAAAAVAGTRAAFGGPAATAPDAEPAPVPGLPADGLVDAHLHLWDLSRFKLPWLKGASPLDRTLLLPDFRKAAAGVPVAAAVYMEVDVHPSQRADEAAYAVALCRDPANRVAGAVVGGYPHADGFAGHLAKFAGETCVKGLRMVLHSPDRPRGLCLQARFVESMKRLGDAGLSFDLCMRPDELLDAAKLAGLCPGTTFVLDHCGNVGLRPESDPAHPVWAEGVKAVADRPNVVCKVSGLLGPGRGDLPAATVAARVADQVGRCADAFGEDRLLFGGDWPVCGLGGGYRAWVAALAAAVADRSPEFRRKLFRDNATRVYRL